VLPLLHATAIKSVDSIKTLVQAYQDDTAAATLGASLSSLVSGLSISAPFLSEASATTVGAVHARADGAN
jgi:hypothetical protein